MSSAELDDIVKTVWYIEADNESGAPVVSGSAVAVRLANSHVPNTAETYLLCAEHVIRGRSQDGVDGFGSLLNRIRAWQIGDAHTEQQARLVTCEHQIKTPMTDETPMAQPVFM